MRSLLDERPSAPLITPRDYQREDTDACLAGWREVQRLLAVLPTGAGKTVMAGHLAERHADEYGGRTLFLAHRDELIRQTCEKFAAVWPSVDLGVVKAGEDDCRADVVVASMQTVVNPKRLQRILGGRPIGLVIADEAHHLKAKTWEQVIIGAGCFTEGGPHLLGLTATPARGDGKGLDMFERVVVDRDIRWGIQHRHLVDIRAKRIHLSMDLDKVKSSHGDYADGDLGRAMHDADAPDHIVAAFLEHAPERKAICFVPTLELAEQVADAFMAKGVSAAFVAGWHDSDYRQALYARLRSGDLRVIVSVAVLTEGFDEPSVDCVVLARPTQSAGLFVQMAGRGLRTFPGKSDCLLIDVLGVTKRHRLRVAADLLGASEKAREEADRLGIPIGEAIRRDEEATPTGGRLVAEEVDLWAEFDQAPVAWSTNGAGSFLIQLGSKGREQRWLRMRQDDGRWVIAMMTRTGGDPFAARVLGAFDDMGLAQGFAESQAQMLGGTLAMKDAAWRKDEATIRQLETLDKMRIVYERGISRGEASRLISERIARRIR